MPSYKFARLTEKDAEYLQGLSGMAGLEGELSDDGLVYTLDDGEGNLAYFRLNPETKEITVEYDPEGDNEIFEQEEAIRDVLVASTVGSGRRRRSRRGRKTAKKSRRSRRRHTARRVR